MRSLPRSSTTALALVLLSAVTFALATLQARAATAPFSWGRNSDGQLGDGTLADRYKPGPVSRLTDVVAISAGFWHGLAVNRDGTVWAWGYNGDGQLGDGTTDLRLTPVQTAGLTNVLAVAAGPRHSLALKADGTVWAWGLNSSGQLGDGTTVARHTPVQAATLANIVAVAAGNGHSLAVKADGTLWTWGANDHGQLGDGSTTGRSSPAQVAALADVAGVVAGAVHSLAVKGDGSVWAWGNNQTGQLGDGTTTTRHAPVQTLGLTDVASLAAGEAHSLALKRDGTVWGWGANPTGQLGDGTTTRRLAPVRMTGLTGVVTVAAGVWHSLAVRIDGTAWACGSNTWGQLGDGTGVERHTPVRVKAPARVETVSSGGLFSLALGQPDSLPPTVALAAPARGAFLPALSALSGSAADEPDGSGLLNVTVRLRRNRDGSAIGNRYWKPGAGWVLSPTGATLPVAGQESWAVTSGLPSGADLPDGQYLIYVTATDNAGNSRTITSYFWVDAHPPVSVAFTSPTHGQVVSNLAAITGTAADAPNSTGIRKIVVRVRQLNGPGTGDDRWWNGSAWQAAVANLATESTAGEGEPAFSTWRVTAGMPIGALPQGRYVLYAYAYDRGHMVSTAITITAP